MRKEIFVGEITYNIKGAAFEVITNGGCSLCTELLKDCSRIACISKHRQDDKFVGFKHRSDLDRTYPAIGVFVTPKGKRWEVVPWSGDCSDCALWQKPKCSEFNCNVKQEGEKENPPQVMLKRRIDLE